MNARERFREFEGELWDGARVVRIDYAKHHRTIRTGRELRATLRAGKYAWPGGYRLALMTDDGALLCWPCAIDNAQQVIRAVREHDTSSGWRVVGVTGEHESDDSDWCAHCQEMLWSDES